MGTKGTTQIKTEVMYDGWNCYVEHWKTEDLCGAFFQVGESCTPQMTINFSNGISVCITAQENFEGIWNMYLFLAIICEECFWTYEKFRIYAARIEEIGGFVYQSKTVPLHFYYEKR